MRPAGNISAQEFASIPMGTLKERQQQWHGTKRNYFAGEMAVRRVKNLSTT
ncbi:MAG: hypothetical protein JWQ87_5417 [Candidatus Sulfotelmatobacter sp.]|nr:hypothetical protein [Candidatus Sulfotelmatobacter sp.]